MPSVDRRRLAEARAEYRRAQADRSPALASSPHRVYELLRSSISNGTLSMDATLVESQLMQLLGASRTSVRKALQLLVEDGLVVRQTRVGTTLTRYVFPVRAGETGPRVRPSTPAESRLRYETLECVRTAAPGLLRARFGRAPAEVLLVEQVAYSQEQPLFLRVTYVDTEVAAAEWTERLAGIRADHPPLAVAFERLHGVPFGGTHAVVEAVGCRDRTADLLAVPSGSPILLQDLAVYDDAGLVREISFGHFRGDRIALSTLESHTGAVPGGPAHSPVGKFISSHTSY
jgi:GntR family transcriptional regulator